MTHGKILWAVACAGHLAFVACGDDGGSSRDGSGGATGHAQGGAGGAIEGGNGGGGGDASTEGACEAQCQTLAACEPLEPGDHEECVYACEANYDTAVTHGCGDAYIAVLTCSVPVHHECDQHCVVEYLTYLACVSDCETDPDQEVCDSYCEEVPDDPICTDP
jgi:hypothetical protein